MVEVFTALLESFLHNPVVIAIGAGIVMAVGAWVKGRLSGAKAERNKQAVERVAARDEADKIDQAVAGMSDAEVLKEQAKWSRPKF
ncbi:MAG: ABC transporter permease [Mesorhizobium sp.]|uniref:ABC transporter permease n=1 Tax=unclassified Mesorhizobium TaxID=325217 RepID=UPI000F76123A|nr:MULTISPECIES: ABC transporter permease [unclassified Mesorhizobium]AZO47094.1 ABC transporter permease [Mesorhizobium sp. M4B.F.Ca.ET.058.02.1.1]RWC57747.1 MAG: ABC transporter permease [Mesorhizobium sp.]RWD13828.1 MAG: ABC transporter permease [Mesorhizobium sp.]RWD55543.1 MAG: ABC transporter permease [Mesorhizobium sp.]TIU68623.1 MAG: ABC transporter permease [Mesorhizobium sp.]